MKPLLRFSSVPGLAGSCSAGSGSDSCSAGSDSFGVVFWGEGFLGFIWGGLQALGGISFYFHAPLVIRDRKVLM